LSSSFAQLLDGHRCGTRCKAVDDDQGGVVPRLLRGYLRESCWGYFSDVRNDQTLMQALHAVWLVAISDTRSCNTLTAKATWPVPLEPFADTCERFGATFDPSLRDDRCTFTSGRRVDCRYPARLTLHPSQRRRHQGGSSMRLENSSDPRRRGNLSSLAGGGCARRRGEVANGVAAVASACRTLCVCCPPSLRPLCTWERGCATRSRPHSTLHRNV